MQQKQGDCIFLLREEAHKMNRDPFDFGLKLREAVDSILRGIPNTRSVCRQVLDVVSIPFVGSQP